MKMMNGGRVAGLLLLAGIVLFAGGCGFKNYPVPPESVVPKPIEDLRYTVDAKGVTLTWTYPVQTVKGTDIQELSSFELYRAVVPVEDYCSGCPIPFGEPQMLPGGVITKGDKRQGSYQTSLLRSGHKYFFMIRSRTSWWAESNDSNIVSFIWHTPAKAPDGLKVNAGDGKATLTWEPVSEYMDGRKLDLPLEYQVLRSQAGSGFEAVGKPVAGPEYIDKPLVNSQKYTYKVQSVLLLEGNTVGGGISEEASVVPIDTTPPPPPNSITVVEIPGGIKVYWDRPAGADIAGYRVYRRTSAQDTPVLIGETDAATLSFNDTHVPAGVRVYYSIKSFDARKPSNTSDFSKEATLRH